MAAEKNKLDVRGNTERRLKIMDDLLASGERIIDRAHFTQLVNQRRNTNDAPIKVDQMSKQIEKLKALIEPYGVELKYSQSAGYRYSEPGYSYFKKEIQETDKHLLMLASSIFAIFRGTPIQDRFTELVNKMLVDSISSGPVKDLENLQLVQIGNGPSFKGTHYLPDLVNAIIEKECLEIRYTSLRKKTSRKILSPYLLKQHNGRWFLVAHDKLCDRPEKTNIYTLDSIQELKTSYEPYFSDPAFNPKDFFNYCLGIWHYHNEKPEKIVLEFTQNTEELLAAPLHHSQKTRISGDGQTLTVEILVYNTPELEKMILSYGASVKVIEPLSLRKSVQTKAADIARLYKNVSK